MLKKINFNILLLVATNFMLVSCSSESDTSPNGNMGNQSNNVSNLVVEVNIQGEDADNPNGDGSGVFYGTATADNAVNYGFRIGNNGDETQNTTRKNENFGLSS